MALNGRRHQRYPASCLAKLEYLDHGLRGVRSMPCRLENISVGGAAVRIPETPARPDHLYLVIPGHDQRLGCGVAYRDNTRLGLQFLKEMDESVLLKLLKTGLASRR